MTTPFRYRLIALLFGAAVGAGVAGPVQTSSAQTGPQADTLPTPTALLGNAWWQNGPRMTMATRAQSDLFGSAVAVGGVWAIIGARQDDTAAGSNAGSATFYERQATQWVRRGLVTANDGGANHNFGDAVAISGDWAVVGAPNASADGLQSAGAAYVFQRSGSTWNLHSKLTAFDAQEFGQFGRSVSIDGDSIAVGDDEAAAGAGQVYVFRVTTGAWLLEHMLVPADAAAGNRFGVALAISGNSLAVGAIGQPVAGVFAGSTYVFDRSGIAWSESQKLLPSGPIQDGIMGNSVDLDGDRLVAGSRESLPGIGNAGAAYVFTRSAGVWSLQQRLLDASPASNEQFGMQVAVSGTRVLALTNLGVVAIHDFDGSSWNLSESLDDSSGGVDFFNLNPPFFPSSIALDGGRLIAGSPNEDTGRGAAHPFEWLPATATTLSSAVPEPGRFGEVVTFNVQVQSDLSIPQGAFSILAVADNGIWCSTPLSAGLGSCQAFLNQVGDIDLFVHYLPDANFAGSVSAPFTHSTLPSATTTSITGDTPDPSLLGDPVTVDFNVASAACCDDDPQGQVLVTDGVNSCMGTLSGRTGSCILSFAGTGPHALVASYPGDGNFEPSSSTAEPHTVGETGADLAITKRQCARSTAPGFSHDYELVVENTSATLANGVVIDDPLPPEVSFVATLPPAAPCAFDGMGSHLHCDWGDLAPAARAVVIVQVLVNIGASGTMTNTASTGMLAPDPSPANNSATRTTLIVPDLLFGRDFESCDGSP